jgi:hypothetical protein
LAGLWLFIDAQRVAVVGAAGCPEVLSCGVRGVDGPVGCWVCVARVVLVLGWVEAGIRYRRGGTRCARSRRCRCRGGAGC